jgi:5-methylcytosine-specific restriction endonuclease McrA
MATSFEEIAKRIPVNRVAARALQPGFNFEFSHKNPQGPRSFAPFPTTKDVPATIKGFPVKNLTGLVVGRLTVIGRYFDPDWRRRKKLRWVVRCTCGYYEVRRTSALALENPPLAQMCIQCRNLEDRRNGRGPWLAQERAATSTTAIQITPRSDLPRLPERHFLPYKKTPIPPALRWAVWARDDFRCQVCGTRKHLSVDHILAESKGGLMVIENLQTLCSCCNSKKGAN